VGAEGYVDLTTAVYLAAASNVTAPAGPLGQGLAMQYATDTFNATIAHDTLLQAQGQITCPGDYNAGGTVVCQAQATLLFSKTPLAVVIPVDPTIQAQAQATRSAYRSVPVP
jgi:hypothetical protein